MMVLIVMTVFMADAIHMLVSTDPVTYLLVSTYLQMANRPNQESSDEELQMTNRPIQESSDEASAASRALPAAHHPPPLVQVSRYHWV